MNGVNDHKPHGLLLGIAGVALGVLLLSALLGLAPGYAQRSPQSEQTHLSPQQAHLGKEAQSVLAAGAKRLDIPEFKTYAVYWFPSNYASLPNHRVLFALHGSSGNAYQAVYHQLEQARQNNYGVIALQWWQGGKENYMPPKDVEAALFKAYQDLSRQYPIHPHQIALETFSRSGANSYEVAYWNKALNHPPYRLIIVQSGGIPKSHPRPMITDMLNGLYGKTPLANTRFFFYCGRQDREWGEGMCEQIHFADQVITQLGGKTLRLIDDPQGGHGGLHNIQPYREEALTAFLKATQLPASKPAKPSAQ